MMLKLRTLWSNIRAKQRRWIRLGGLCFVSALFCLGLVPMGLLWISWLRTPTVSAVDLDASYSLVRFTTGIDPDLLPWRTTKPELAKQVMLRHQTWETNRKDRQCRVLDVRPFGSSSTWDVTGYGGGEIPVKFVQAISVEELEKSLRQPNRLEASFVSMFRTVHVMTHDIDRDGNREVVLRVVFERDEWQDDIVCAYRVREGEAEFLWAYQLDKNISGPVVMFDFDRISWCPDGTAEIQIFKPFCQVSLLRYDPLQGAYVHQRARFWSLPSFWRMAVGSLFSVPSWFICGRPL
jgi:hypothetical protein